MRRRRRTGWRCPRCQTPKARRAARNAHQREMYHKYYKKNRRRRYSSGCLIPIISVLFSSTLFVFFIFTLL